MKILSVVGARPNFMKIAPFIRAVDKYNKSDIHKKNVLKHLLVHTGQHYDDRMSKEFFEQLGIPKADINLGIGSGTHAEQVGLTMIEFEKVVKKEKPDWIVIVGDVNAILACSVTAKKEHIKCCHIEAGLRSGDTKMPEEINRIVADRLSDLLLTPDIIASENLRKEGTPDSNIVLVGNIMIDTLDLNIEKAAKLDIKEVLKNNSINESWKTIDNKRLNELVILTLHRPSNVDTRDILQSITQFIMDEVSRQYPVVWSLHPRTRKMLELYGLWDHIMNNKQLLLLQSIGYLEMLKLNMNAKMMLTDSGGLQEECTVLGTPCLTLRWNTERPMTLKENGGVSILVGNEIARIRSEYNKTKIVKRLPFRPYLWDGHTAERCLEEILKR